MPGRHVAAFLVLLAGGLWAAGPRIAENGVAKAAIVVPDAATAVERRAAAELADGLKRVTGATFAVCPESAEPACTRLLVGATKASANLRKGKTWAFDEVLVARAPGGLVLDGHAERGPLYAVNAFLERHLGVRWWTSTEATYPHADAPVLPEADYSHTPPFKYREAYYLDAFDPLFKVRAHVNYTSLARYEIVKNRRIPADLGGDYGLYFFEGRKSDYHSFFEVLPPKTHFDAHPEWYSLVKGKRQAKQLCLTNTEMKKAFIAELLRRLRAAPDTNFIQVSQNDWHGACACDACRAVEAEEGGAHAGPLLRFVNDVAEAVEREFHEVRVDTFAYQYTRKAPAKTRPRKNVVVRLCDIECAFNRPLGELDCNKAFLADLAEWKRVAPGQLFIWDYTVDFWSSMLPHPNLPVLAPNVRAFAAAGAVGVFEQGDATCAAGEFAPLKFWLLARLLWDPAQDERGLVDEFLAGYYGPSAAPLLRRYLELLHGAAAKGKPMTCFHQGVADWIDAGTMLAAKELMDEAVTAAERDGGDFGARVRRERLTTDHALLVHWKEWRPWAEKHGKPWPLPEPRREAARRWLATCDAFGVIAYKETMSREPFQKYRQELIQ